jgi:hypothetical protein
MKPIAKCHAQERLDWDEAMGLFRAQLSFYLEYLIEGECGNDILAKVEADVKNQSVPDEFKLRYIERVLARHVIQHMRGHAHEAQGADAGAHDSLAFPGTAPPMERLVYFLRDILEYSTRDTSLLMGITDAQVEKLLSAARKRIDMYDGPLSTEIEDENEMYFRWKFVDLHLR